MKGEMNSRKNENNKDSGSNFHIDAANFARRNITGPGPWDTKPATHQLKPPVGKNGCPDSVVCGFLDWTGVVNRVCRGWKARKEKEKSRRRVTWARKDAACSHPTGEQKCMAEEREENAFPTTCSYPMCILCLFLLSFLLFFLIYVMFSPIFRRKRARTPSWSKPT